jgi:hypothetical protein
MLAAFVFLGSFSNQVGTFAGTRRSQTVPVAADNSFSFAAEAKFRVQPLGCSLEVRQAEA